MSAVASTFIFFIFLLGLTDEIVEEEEVEEVEEDDEGGCGRGCWFFFLDGPGCWKTLSLIMLGGRGDLCELELCKHGLLKIKK